MGLSRAECVFVHLGRGAWVIEDKEMVAGDKARRVVLVSCDAVVTPGTALVQRLGIRLLGTQHLGYPALEVLSTCVALWARSPVGLVSTGSA